MEKDKSYSDRFQDDNMKSIEQAFFSELDAIRSPLADNSRTFESGSKRDADETKPLVNHFDAYCRLRYGYLLRKGANHYGKNNWKLGQPDEAAIESLNRHLALYEVGDRNEDHLSAIIFNVQLLMKNEEKEGITFKHYHELSTI
jgi:hypothetical protein